MKNTPHNLTIYLYSNVFTIYSSVLLLIQYFVFSSKFTETMCFLKDLIRLYSTARAHFAQFTLKFVIDFCVYLKYLPSIN